MKDLTPSQVADWFDEQAAKFSKMAQEVRASFSLPSKAVSLSAPQVNLPSRDAELPMGSVTPAQLREYLKTKGGRVEHLAKAFKVTEAAIQQIINNSANGIEVQKRGWVKLVGEAGAPVPDEEET